MSRRFLILFLIVYIASTFIYSSQKTILIDPDGASRGIFAVMLKDITLNKEGVLNTIIKYNSRYQVGLEPILQWAPLQVLCLYLVSLVTSNYEFAFTLINLPYFLLLVLYTYRLTKLLFDEEKTAVFACLVLALHPLVFDTVFSLRRGLGEASFILINSYYFVIFLKRRELKALLSALIFLLVGFLYRESVMIPVLIFLSFVAFIWTGKSYAPIFSKKELFAQKGKAAVAAALIALISSYILIQIPLTGKGVGTLFTKGANYKQWNAEKFDVEGLVTMDDYFSVASVYPMLRFNKEALKDIERENESFYGKIRLIESRFSLPLYKKGFFILSTIFYQWYLLPFFIIGIFLSSRICRVKYATAYLLSVFIGYFAVLSKTGIIPDFNLPMMPLIAICSSAGFFALSRILLRSFYKISSLFIILICVIHMAYAEKTIVLHQKIDVAPLRVIEDLIRDNADRKPFTVLLDSHVAPIYSLILAELDKEGVVYLRPVVLETIDGNRLSGYIKKGGFKRMTNLLDEIDYPEARYILTLSPKQLEYYRSLMSPEELPFRIHNVISQRHAMTNEHIYKRWH